MLSAACLLLWCPLAHGQNILDNDTLYIETVTSGAGQSVELPIYIKTTEYYQGWTIPISFGRGNSPLVCDSVSLEGTIMESWAWTSTFVNNNQWDNVQTCGATGVYVWFGDSLDPGYYLALRLFFTIHDTASPQEIRIDTTTCSFAQGGQQNSYLVVVHLESWLTPIIAGAIVIPGPGVNENDHIAAVASMNVYPNVVSAGSRVHLDFVSPDRSPISIELYDLTGRKVDYIYHGATEQASLNIEYSIPDLSPGVYYIVTKTDRGTTSAKLIVK